MTPPAKYLKADERRALTVQAVVELAGSQNPDEITTASLARHMGVTQGALFRHFPTKDAIWGSVLEWAVEHLLARLDRASAPNVSAVSALEAMFMTHVEFVVEHPGIPRMLFGELQRSSASPAKLVARTLMQRYSERLIRVLERGEAASELTADLDRSAAATLFIGTIQGLVMQSLLSGDPLQVRRDAPRVFAIYRRGIERQA